jgi:hypothetical protein
MKINLIGLITNSLQKEGEISIYFVEGGKLYMGLLNLWEFSHT